MSFKNAVYENRSEKGGFHFYLTIGFFLLTF